MITLLEDNMQWITMGRLVYEKGVQNLIAAMPKILDNYHDAKLIIAGKAV